MHSKQKILHPSATLKNFQLCIIKSSNTYMVNNYEATNRKYYSSPLIKSSYWFNGFSLFLCFFGFNFSFVNVNSTGLSVLSPRIFHGEPLVRLNGSFCGHQNAYNSPILPLPFRANLFENLHTSSAQRYSQSKPELGCGINDSNNYNFFSKLF